jgi:hypothetical protein
MYVTKTALIITKEAYLRRVSKSWEKETVSVTLLIHFLFLGENY